MEDKINWEGTGVEPDVKVPAADALTTAKKLAAEKVAAKPATQEKRSCRIITTPCGARLTKPRC